MIKSLKGKALLSLARRRIRRSELLKFVEKKSPVYLTFIERLNVRMHSGIILLLILPVLSGCATLSVTINAPPEPELQKDFLAGASKIDITPPPGYPMGGHSIAGKIGRGHWLRLSARSIFLEDPVGTRMALVSTDLWSIPAGLADKVAELISNGPFECRIGRSSLIIAATHTHQSPANFSSSPMYNTFASPLPGYDPAMLNFLSERIALSVEQACLTRRKAELFFNKKRLTNKPFARNRSFEAFLANEESADILKENKDLQVGDVTPEYPFSESYRAIDPTLKVLRIREADSPHGDIAIAAFISVHNTSMTHDAQFYNSDLFGAASILAENELSKKSSSVKPVVAIFNGAEGDISPAWNAQDRRDTIRLGKQLAAGILDLSPGKVLQGALNYRFDIKELPDNCLPCREGQWRTVLCPEDQILCTDKDPLSGVGMLGGAEDGRTFFYYLGCREGVQGYYNKAQGHKEPALNCLKSVFATSLNAFDIYPSPSIIHASDPISDALSRLLLEVVSAPRKIPIGVYSIGSLVIATLPGEFTMVMGRRIAAEITNQINKNIKPHEVVLIGLANEYISYFTTPDEYQMQAYEGASTLYGVASGELVRHDLGLVAQSLSDEPPTRDTDITRSYSVGFIKRFGLSTIQSPIRSTADLNEQAFGSVLQDAKTGRTKFDSLPVFCWEGRNKNLDEYAPTALKDVSVIPNVSIIDKNSDGRSSKPFLLDGIPENDTGLNFVSLVVSHSDDNVKWCTFWLMPEKLVRQHFAFYFAVVTTDGCHLVSPECVWDSGEVSQNCRFSATWQEKDFVNNPLKDLGSCKNGKTSQ